MAWTEAARKAALEARRRKRSSMVDFHQGGTPSSEVSKFYTTSDYRKRLAVKLKSVRTQLLRNPDFHSKNKMNETMMEAGRAEMHRRQTQGYRISKILKKKTSVDQSLRSYRDRIYRAGTKALRSR